MSFWIYPVLISAGIAAGTTGTVAGLASLVSYPVLLALGVPPVSANVANTVALVFGGLSSVSASRVELTGQNAQLRPLALATVAGGIAGGLLLLAAPASSFEYVVPWLIAGASAAILLPRRARPAKPHRLHHPALLAGTTLIGVYGGYFGAASGVLLLALLMAMHDESFARSNAAKNLLLMLANAVAALVFIYFGAVRWLVALPLAVGFLIGGRLGPVIVRRTPPAPLRLLVALAGLALALDLGWQTYR